MSTRTDTLSPHTTLCRTARSPPVLAAAAEGLQRLGRTGLGHRAAGAVVVDPLQEPGHRHAVAGVGRPGAGDLDGVLARSEEHTSELQSLMRISYAVFCLKNIKTTSTPKLCNVITYI